MQINRFSEIALKNTPTVYIGCMTGTSVDAVADFTAAIFATNGTIQYHSNQAVKLPSKLQSRLYTASTNYQHLTAQDKIQLTEQLTLFLYQAYLTVIDTWGLSQYPKTRIILSPHGQTIQHQPTQKITEQLLDGTLLANKTGYAVVHQHRTACLQVSNAAPLAPILLQKIFAQSQTQQIIINGGGIANMCVLPQAPTANIIGYDIGPANGPIDNLIQYYQIHQPHSLPTFARQSQYDPHGKFSASGTLISSLYHNLSSHPFFSLPILQKSADRNDFNLNWIGQETIAKYNAADICHTVFQVIADSILKAIFTHTQSNTPTALYFYGGLCHNTFIMDRIKQGCRQQPAISINTLTNLGYDPDFIESLLMAYLGFCVQQQRTINLSYCAPESTRSANCIPGIITQPQQITTKRI